MVVPLISLTFELPSEFVLLVKAQKVTNRSSYVALRLLRPYAVQELPQGSLMCETSFLSSVCPPSVVVGRDQPKINQVRTSLRPTNVAAVANQNQLTLGSLLRPGHYAVVVPATFPSSHDRVSDRYRNRAQNEVDDSNAFFPR